MLSNEYQIDLFKVNLLISNVGNFSKESFQRNFSFISKTEHVEIENFTKQIVDSFPISSSQHSSISFAREYSLVKLNFINHWSIPLTKYQEMNQFFSTFAVIGFLDFSQNVHCWEEAIDEFHRIINENLPTKIVRIFIFNSDDTLDMSLLRKKEHIVIPNQDEEKIQFYMQTLIEGIVSSIVKELLKMVEEFKEREKELIFTPDSINEIRGSIEGLANIKNRSVGRKCKIVGDILALMGNVSAASVYYKRAITCAKNNSDALWNTCASESSYLAGISHSISSLYAHSSSDEFNHVACFGKFKEFSAQYAKVKCFFLSCQSLVYACNWLMNGKCYHEAAKILIMLTKTVESLTETEEKLHFFLYARQIYKKMNMNRKVSLMDYAIARLSPKDGISLSFDALKSFSSTDDLDWIEAKKGFITNCLVYVPDGYCLNQYAHAALNTLLLSKLFLQLTAEQQMRIYNHLSSCHYLNEIPIPSLHSFVESFDFCPSFLQECPFKFNAENEREKADVFIYSPLQEKSRKKSSLLHPSQEILFICNEMVTFTVSLSNPFAFDVELEDIHFEGTNFKYFCTSNSVKIPSKSLIFIETSIIPLSEGKVSIDGLHFVFLKREFQFATAKNKKLKAVIDKSDDSDSIVKFEYQVIQPMPRIQIVSCNETNYISLYQGENIIFKVQLRANQIPYEIVDLTLVDYESGEKLKISYEISNEVLTIQLKTVLESSKILAVILRYSSLDKKYQRTATTIFSVNIIPTISLSKIAFNSTVDDSNCVFMCDIQNHLNESVSLSVYYVDDLICELLLLPGEIKFVHFEMPKNDIFIEGKSYLIDLLLKRLKMMWKLKAFSSKPTEEGSLKDCCGEVLLTSYKNELQISSIFHYNNVPFQISFNINDACPYESASNCIQIISRKFIKIKRGIYFEIPFELSPKSDIACTKIEFLFNEHIKLKKFIFLKSDDCILRGITDYTGHLKMTVQFNDDLAMLDEIFIESF